MSQNIQPFLACPVEKSKLQHLSLEEASRQAGAKLASVSVSSMEGVNRAGPTPWVLLGCDGKRAYPVIDGIPILLAPEALVPAGSTLHFDRSNPLYAETYAEMKFYNEVADREVEDLASSESFRILKPILDLDEKRRRDFPRPRQAWIDAVYDCQGQWEIYEHLGPMKGKRVLQLGGKGIHAVKFLLAGAAEAWLVSPMLGEARGAHALARACGVGDRIRSAVGIAEELPFADGSFDAVYSGGCVHHMITDLAFPEIARILASGGRFGAVDPWKVPFLHVAGTRILGKRETEVHCKPLDSRRVAPFFSAFSTASVVHHAALTRYPLLALNKFKIPCSLDLAWKIFSADDRLSSSIPGLRSFGSSVALMATRH